MMDALTIFGEDSFIFNFVGYGLVTKSLGGGWGGYVHIWGGVVKKKCQKMNVIFVTTK